MNTQEKVKKFRKDNSLSQRALAELLKVNTRTVQRWESGDRTPHPTILKLLEKISVK